MSKEVKRWKRSQLEYMHPEHEVVDAKAYEALLAERDALKRELALWEPIHYEIHRRADKMCCLEDQCDFTVEIQHETYAALQGAQP